MPKTTSLSHSARIASPFSVRGTTARYDSCRFNRCDGSALIAADPVFARDAETLRGRQFHAGGFTRCQPPVPYVLDRDEPADVGISEQSL